MLWRLYFLASQLTTAVWRRIYYFRPSLVTCSWPEPVEPTDWPDWRTNLICAHAG